jgi:hypothetical protein
MKNYVIIGALLLMKWSVHSQGRVLFANRVLTPPPDRLVYNVDGVTPLVGSNWCAQLYYGRDASSLNPVSAPPRLFYDPNTTPPGIWNGALHTLVGFSTGETAILQVRVWDCALFQDFDSAQAGGGTYGISVPFSYLVPPSDSIAYTMVNFQGFSLVPEPTMIGLFVVSAAVVFARFRRRE